MLKRFWIFAVILLGWNLAGLAAFVMQLSSEPEALGDPVTARAFATMPAWAWVAYAVATIAGTAGALALLMRRKVAWLLFALSLSGFVAQFGWSLLAFNLVQQKGASVIVFPLVIALLALFGTVYSSRAAKRGILR